MQPISHNIISTCTIFNLHGFSIYRSVKVLCMWRWTYTSHRLLYSKYSCPNKTRYELTTFSLPMGNPHRQNSDPIVTHYSSCTTNDNGGVVNGVGASRGAEFGTDSSQHTELVNWIPQPVILVKCLPCTVWLLWARFQEDDNHHIHLYFEKNDSLLSPRCALLSLLSFSRSLSQSLYRHQGCHDGRHDGGGP